ncbi:hypothetical protein UAW_02095 [Enterococcus haemoperoxidus ATCC BAA-382]|uniref:Uncharacterized protein n=1 Tax=Enterococcus haemoperoxidus ATCC BAA-382 TaxID=1158608 RepID=R2SQE8_9ENTE|nr:DUF916 and DUF3324 domain-containing protein [Enterococcus haemoperoxidus]EOH95016.1 hypothetical protein UAW_02095 [Enterococcus haemoperoxidus ATCC BAA-382]EOT60415.1 hypothetical protein I583_03061 [Enterococcus haemoperoxidus ATCC BAA-382]OJG54848.1 hypothetical protein RV06_GL002370 [Enterococcus haemoperoxidus]
MLKRIRKVLLPLVVVFLGCLVGTVNVWAQDAGYEVKAIPSATQVDQAKTYFDLRIEPKESETIKVKVTNQSNQERIINTQVKTATTNSNGVVEYIKSDQNQSIDLPYDLSKLIQTKTPKIKLAPHESKEVEYTITMPEKDFSGILSGGIIFTSKNTDQTEDSTASVAIKNQFGYVIALVLHGKNEVEPDLSLSKVSLGQVNNRNVIFAHLANPKAAYLNRLNLTATIKKKNTDKILYETKKNERQMAPNSIFNYPISLQETEFKPGKYLLSLHAESKGKNWDFEEEFEIKAEEAKKMNDQAYIHQDKHNYWLYLILFLIFLVLILLFILYKKRQQKIKALEEQVEELKKK